MLVECPHCFTTVAPKSDGTCPACQANTQDGGANPDRTSIRVAQGTVLPLICCDCGNETDRRVPVCRRSSEGRSDTPGCLKAIVFLFLPWYALQKKIGEIQRTNVVKIDIPQCEMCRLIAEPEVRYVDFANVRMTILVHKNLKQAINADRH